MKSARYSIFVLLLLLLVSCRDAETRLNSKVEGTYKLIYFSKNNIEYSGLWAANYNLTFRFYRPEPDLYIFKLDGSIKKSNTWYSYTSSSPYSAYMDSDEQYIRFAADIPSYEYDSLYPDMLFYPIINDPGTSVNEYHILKIGGEEMQLEYYNGNDTYSITLKSVS